MVRRAEAEGKTYLPDGGKVTFTDFVELCRVDIEGREVNWDDPAIDRMVPGLKEKKLVKLRLI